MSDTEKIIAIVKMYPLIYDHRHKDYKNPKKKEEAWSDISAELDQHVEAVKRKWKNIRDSYSKYVRSRRNPLNKASSTRYKNWIWGKEMDSIMPCYNRTDDDHYDDTAPTKITETEPPQQQQRRIFKRPSPPDESTYPAFDDEHERSSGLSYMDMDAVELLFLGYAKTVGTFSAKRQAITKFQISQIIMEQELEHQDEMNRAINVECILDETN